MFLNDLIQEKTYKAVKSSIKACRKHSIGHHASSIAETASRELEAKRNGSRLRYPHLSVEDEDTIELMLASLLASLKSSSASGARQALAELTVFLGNEIVDYCQFRFEKEVELSRLLSDSAKEVEDACAEFQKLPQLLGLLEGNIQQVSVLAHLAFSANLQGKQSELLESLITERTRLKERQRVLREELNVKINARSVQIKSAFNLTGLCTASDEARHVEKSRRLALQQQRNASAEKAAHRKLTQESDIETTEKYQDARRHFDDAQKNNKKVIQKNLIRVMGVVREYILAKRAVDAINERIVKNKGIVKPAEGIEDNVCRERYRVQSKVYSAEREDFRNVGREAAALWEAMEELVDVSIDYEKIEERKDKQLKIDEQKVRIKLAKGDLPGFVSRLPNIIKQDEAVAPLIQWVEQFSPEKERDKAKSVFSRKLRKQLGRIVLKLRMDESRNPYLGNYIKEILTKLADENGLGVTLVESCVALYKEKYPFETARLLLPEVMDTYKTHLRLKSASETFGFPALLARLDKWLGEVMSLAAITKPGHEFDSRMRFEMGSIVYLLEDQQETAAPSLLASLYDVFGESFIDDCVELWLMPVAGSMHAEVVSPVSSVKLSPVVLPAAVSPVAEPVSFEADFTQLSNEATSISADVPELEDVPPPDVLSEEVARDGSSSVLYADDPDFNPRAKASGDVDLGTRAADPVRLAPKSFVVGLGIVTGLIAFAVVALAVLIPPVGALVAGFGVIMLGGVAAKVALVVGTLVTGVVAGGLTGGVCAALASPIYRGLNKLISLFKGKEKRLSDVESIAMPRHSRVAREIRSRGKSTAIRKQVSFSAPVMQGAGVVVPEYVPAAAVKDTTRYTVSAASTEVFPRPAGRVRSASDQERQAQTDALRLLLEASTVSDGVFKSSAAPALGGAASSTASTLTALSRASTGSRASVSFRASTGFGVPVLPVGTQTSLGDVPAGKPKSLLEASPYQMDDEADVLAPASSGAAAPLGGDVSGASTDIGEAREGGVSPRA